MAIQIGGVDVPNTLINCEWRIGVLERIVERLGRMVPAGAISQADIDGFREEVFAQLQVKYPGIGLARAPTRTAPILEGTPTSDENLPVGVPVAGEPGLVYSPYAKEKKMSVQGYKQGEVVICPYTSRKFRVP